MLFGTFRWSLHVLCACVRFFSWHFSSFDSPSLTKLRMNSLTLMQQRISLCRLYFLTSPNWLQPAFDEKPSRNKAAADVESLWSLLTCISIRHHKSKTQPFIWLRGDQLSSTSVGGAAPNCFGVSNEAFCLLAKWIPTCVSYLSFVPAMSQEHKAVILRAGLWYLWPVNQLSCCASQDNNKLLDFVPPLCLLLCTTTMSEKES